jgi:hypothetical protein
MKEEIKNLEMQHSLDILEILISIEEFNENAYKLNKLKEIKEYITNWKNEKV